MLSTCTMLLDKKKVLSTLAIILSFLLLLPQFLRPVKAYGQTIYVDASNINDPLEDGTIDHPFDKIQEGIEYALPGETVLVKPGQYPENLILNKDLTLTGLLDGSGVRPRINPPSGTALLVSDGSDFDVSGFTFSDCEVGIRGTAYGGGVSNGQATIHSNIFTNIHRIGDGFPAYDTQLGGEAIYIGGLLDIYNNIFFNNAGGVGTVALRSDSGTHYFYNNTVSDNDSNFDDGSGGWASLWMAGPRMYIFNNVIVNEATGAGVHLWDPYGSWTTQAQIEYNLMFNNSGGNTTGVPISQTISADPNFLDPNNGDYHLQAGSSCIDAGTNNGAPNTDFDGHPRPIDGDGDGIAAVDIGADEAGPILSHDVAPEVILLPMVAMRLGVTVTPTVRIRNIGTSDEGGFSVICEIELGEEQIYLNTQTVVDLASLEPADVLFADWTPQQVGNYDVNFYTQLVGDENTNNDTLSRTVNVTTLAADFASNLTEGHVPLEVQFADQSTGNATEWLWDFGDGNTSNEQNPIHTYNSCGIYTVSLTISNPTLSDTETKVGFIMVLPDILGIEVGNVWTYQGTYMGVTPYTWEAEVVTLDQTTFPITTYIMDYRQDGMLAYKFWYEKTADQLKRWGEGSNGDMLKYSNGLVEAWYPMEVNDHEYSSATAEMSGFPGYTFNVSMTVDVLSKEPVALSFDTFQPYKLRYQLRIWGYGYDETSTYYQWVIPYLGIVKYQDAAFLETLSVFTIGAGTITQETDADGDGLKDYQELAVYNTNWQNADTDGDGLTDGDEVNIHGTDPNSVDTDNDGLTDSDELALGTDPTESDTDADGLTDGDEVNIHGTDPKIADTDDDDLKDGDEVNIHGTDPLNSDTDGDVMPDGWEVTYELNPLVDDADGDLDDDGVSNLDEYNDGSNPNNKNPAKPELLAPEDGAINVALAPTLETSPFSDPEADGHARTEWQISTHLDDFSDDLLAFKAESDLALTALTVTEYILEENKSYYWRVRFTDDEGAKSGWSDVYGFETGASTVIDQNPANGIPDSQDLDPGDPVQSELDLDDNGTFDINELSDTWKCLNTEAGDGYVGVKVPPGYIINAVESVDPASISDTVNRPDILPHTLVSFSVTVPNAGDSVDITVYLSGTLPNKTQWYTWNAASGWQQFPATFSQTGAGDTEVVFTKTDGETGDADGLANGIIVDPSGPGIVSAPGPAPAAAGGGGGGGGCFIAAAGELPE